MFALLKFFLFFAVFAIFITVFFLLAFLSKIISLIRGPKRSSSGFSHFHAGTSQSDGTQQRQAAPKKKIIPENEGEYVDFEEIN